MVGRIIIGGAVALVVVVAIAWFVRGTGLGAIGRRPGRFEIVAASTAWRFLLPAHARDARNPVAPTPDVLKEASRSLSRSLRALSRE
ncbi:MAG: hypothetical protein ACRD1V_00915 [Vicinamibacterales bacterium]